VAGIDRVPDRAGAEFWSHEVPERALEALLVGDDSLVSDFLVIDEIQDISTDIYLDVLDLMVAGGLQDGRLLLYGDFERQAIFDNENGRDRLRSRVPFLSTHKLIQNCRNLPRIGYQVNLLSDLKPGFQQFRRPDDGIDPVFLRCENGQDQSALVADAIRGLKGEGYELNEIVVLSPLKDGSTASSTNDPWLRQILKPADGFAARPGQVLFSTIHAYKGLEAPAVVVTDLDQSLTADNFESLLYVGLTRATDRLVGIFETTTLIHAIGGSK
jgi:superfamily I DNA/RNA helicase